MPWESLSNVPPQVRTHQGVKLTLAQANDWARIYDAIKNDQKLENPVAVAWVAWRKTHVKKADKWSKRQTEQKFTIKEYSQKAQIITDLLEQYKSDGTEQLYAIFKLSQEEELPGWVLRDTRLLENTNPEFLAEHEFWGDGEWAIVPVQLDFTKEAVALYGGRVAELPKSARYIKIEEIVTTTVQSKTDKDWMESILSMDAKIVGVKQLEEGGPTIIHGVAVTTNVSNQHRFPEDVLDRDIVTLIGQPLVEGHSIWPDDVKSRDVYGVVVDAWFNKEEKRAEFYAEVWDTKYLKVLEHIPHRVKFSVGFKHDFDVKEDIKISKSVFFDHLGTTNRPADPDSVLLGLKEAQARGHQVISNGELAEGGTGMTPEEKKAEEKRVADCKALLEKANVTDEDKKTLEASIESKTTVEDFTAQVNEAVEKKTKADTEEADKKAAEKPSPEPTPSEPESKEAGKEIKALEDKLNDAVTDTKAQEKEIKALQAKVEAFEVAEKRSKVETYVDSLIEGGVKMPSQRDELVEHYLTFNAKQMESEMTINDVEADLSGVFGEKAALKKDEADSEEFDVPDRKKIT